MNHRMPNRYDKKSFSLFYNELARWFFLFMFFAGMFSAYVLGVQFALNYALHQIELIDRLRTRQNSQPRPHFIQKLLGNNASGRIIALNSRPSSTK